MRKDGNMRAVSFLIGISRMLRKMKMPVLTCEV